MRIDIEEKLLRSLLILGSMVEARDAYTGGHLWRVAQLAKLLGRKAGLAGEDLFRLTLGGILHDVGKVGIPDRVLLKDGPLSDEEFAIIKTHPTIGRDLLREHPLGDLVIDVVAHHHEWVDGRGYPEVIDPAEVSSFSLMIGLVDAFDALTSRRPYRKGAPIDEALSTIGAGRGTQFDPGLVDYFLELRGEGALDHVVGHSFDGRPMVECPGCGPVIVIAKGTRDGDAVFCRSCTGKFRLHRKEETFEAESMGEMGTPDQVRPEADLEVVEDVVAQAPASVGV